MDLRTYRKNHGLSLAEMGRMLGVSHTTISRIEAGRALPSSPFLVRLAAVTRGQVTPNDMLLAGPTPDRDRDAA